MQRKHILIFFLTYFFIFVEPNGFGFIRGLPPEISKGQETPTPNRDHVHSCHSQKKQRDVGNQIYVYKVWMFIFRLKPLLELWYIIIIPCVNLTDTCTHICIAWYYYFTLTVRPNLGTGMGQFCIHCNKNETKQYFF